MQLDDRDGQCVTLCPFDSLACLLNHVPSVLSKVVYLLKVSRSMLMVV